jgi:hypothetical protein
MVHTDFIIFFFRLLRPTRIHLGKKTYLLTSVLASMWVYAYRDATGTAQVHEGRREDAVAAAEEAAFCKACARFGFGLYLYHEDDTHHEDHFH